MAKKQKPITIDPLKERTKAGESQQTYWRRFGVTQSCGSRYETGRNISKPIRMLVALANGAATIEQLKSGELAGRI